MMWLFLKYMGADKPESKYWMEQAIRYSKPELQTQITYLYSLTNATDQKIGRDAIERYEVLRKALDERIAQLNRILGTTK